MGRCPGISWSLFLNPGLFYTLLVTLFKAMDFALDGFMVWIFCAGIPPSTQAVLWLVGVVLAIRSELPPQQVMLRNWKTRLRRRYFDIRRWLFPKLYPRKRRKKRIWRQLRTFRRRRLALGLVKRCRHRRYSYHTPTLDGKAVPSKFTSKRRRTRRRNLKSRRRLWKRRVVDNEFFLDGKRKMGGRGIILRNCISEENLNAFCKSSNFLAVINHLKRDESQDHTENAQRAVDRMNACRQALRDPRSSLFVLEAQSGPGITSSVTFENCPVVWDTGASYGLTPFASDFIDYKEVNIQVQDIPHTNIVVGIGTAM